MSKFLPRQGHRATFKGSHNGSKAKTLLVLYDIMYTHGINKGFSAEEIHLLSGVPINTVNSRLGKWHKWGYVSRRAQTNGNGRPGFFYYLGARGKRFVEERIPAAMIKKYSMEIKAFRKARGVKVNITPAKGVLDEDTLSNREDTIEEEDNNEY